MDNNSALIVSAESQTNLASTAIQLWMANLPDHGIKLGVTPKYLARMASDLMLTTDDLETLVAIKDKFPVSISRVKKLVVKGQFTVEEVHDLYELRDAVTNFGGEAGKGEHAVSLKKIVRFVKTFPSADLGDDGLAETIIDFHGRVQRKFRWIKYVDQSISLVCDIARGYGVADIETALDALEGNWSEDNGYPRDEEE